MSLQRRLQDEIKSAMLAKNAERLATLRLVKSAIDYALIDAKKDELSDAETISILQKEVKKRRDSVEQFEKGGRPELAEKEKQEIDIIETFLPQPLAPDELERLVRSTIEELGASSKKDMGQVIKATQAKAAGRADGKSISSLVGRLLP